MREPSKKFKPLFTQETPTEVEQMGLTWLVAAAIVTAIMWQIPFGDSVRNLQNIATPSVCLALRVT